MPPTQWLIKTVLAAIATLAVASLVGIGIERVVPTSVLAVLLVATFLTRAAVGARQRGARWLGLHDLIRTHGFEIGLAAIGLVALGVRVAGIDLGLGHERTDIDGRCHAARGTPRRRCPVDRGPGDADVVVAHRGVDDLGPAGRSRGLRPTHGP